MKICYLWVDHFRNFENQGFNFASDVKFYFDGRLGKLTKENVTPLPKDFFVPSNPEYNHNIGDGKFLDITGLIGRNGGGKSNVLDALLKSVKGAKSTMPTDFLLITQGDSEYTCHTMPESKLNGNIHSEFQLKYSEYSGSLKNLKAVFFSNVYDGRENQFSSEISDISTNRRARRGYKLGEYSDFENQIKFIESKHFDHLNIDTPQKAQFRSRIWNRWNSSKWHRLFGEYFEEFSQIQNDFKRRLSEMIPRTRFFSLIKYSFILRTYDILYDSIPERREYFIQEFIVRLRMDNRTSETLDRTLNWLADEYMQNNDAIQENIEYKRNKPSQKQEAKIIRDQIGILDSLRKRFDELIVEVEIEGKRKTRNEWFYVDYKTKIGREFIHEFSELFRYDPFFIADWIGLSSGHKAYLNMFSSIYHDLRLSRSENLLLCIDEGDLYLHPKWQTEFFSKLLQIIPKIFQKNIQLIITSHSPFILSNLPNQCVTIVEPNAKIECGIIDALQLETKTFAGNIYELYREPFFLGQKRTGDFAADKIKEVIKLLEKKDISSKEKEKARILIEMIGDKVISYYLDNRLNDA